MTYFVGVDVGGTKSAAVLINSVGEIAARHWMEHSGDWRGKLLRTVLSSIEGVLAEGAIGIDQVTAVGVAVAGLVSSNQSTVVYSPIIRESHFDLGGRLSERLARPVIVENDANATLYGITRHARETGAQPGESQVALLLTLGTGFGGSIMVGDRIIVGEHGFAAEVGHVTVDYTDDRRCVCGNRGCIEQFASGRGLEELAVETPPPWTSRATLRSIGATAPYTARDIVAAAELGDPWAVGQLNLCGAMLGRAISVLCVALDPTTVIIGGSFGHATRRWLLPAAVEEMRSRWTYAAERPIPALTMDSIGPYAAATGAAMLAAAPYAKDTGS